MRHDYRTMTGLPTGKVYDGAGRQVTDCFLFDTDTGEFGRYLRGPGGTVVGTTFGHAEGLRFVADGGAVPAGPKAEAEAAGFLARIKAAKAARQQRRGGAS